MESIAHALFCAGAVHWRKETNPLTGRFMIPVYCDTRAVLGYPKHRESVAERLEILLRETYPKVDAIMGVATGGIAFAALAASQLQLPMGYVRSSTKQHGLARQIEGYDVDGKTVILVEDTVFSGSSILSAARALCNAGSQVLGAVSIITYGFKETERRFQKSGLFFTPLASLEMLLSIGVQEGWLDTDIAAHIREYLSYPKADIWAQE